MTDFNPDNELSLKIKQSIFDYAKYVYPSKDSHVHMFAYDKFYLRELAEDYTRARKIKPHTNIKLLQAKIDNDFAYYICECGDCHSYEYTAALFACSLFREALASLVDNRVSSIENTKDFYQRTVLRARTIAYLKYFLAQSMTYAKSFEGLTPCPNDGTISTQ